MNSQGLRRPNLPSCHPAGTPSLWPKHGDNRVRWRSRSDRVGRSRDEISSFHNSDEGWLKWGVAVNVSLKESEVSWKFQLQPYLAISYRYDKNSKFLVVCEVLVFFGSQHSCPLWTMLPGCVVIWSCSGWFTNRSIITCTQERNSWRFYSSHNMLTSNRCDLCAWVHSVDLGNWAIFALFVGTIGYFCPHW